MSLDTHKAHNDLWGPLACVYKRRHRSPVRIAERTRQIGSNGPDKAIDTIFAIAQRGVSPGDARPWRQV